MDRRGETREQDRSLFVSFAANAVCLSCLYPAAAILLVGLLSVSKTV